MDVSNINNSVNTANVNSYAAKNSGAAVNATEDTNAAVVNEVTKKEEQDKDTYESSTEKTYKPDYARMKEIWAEHDEKVASFRKLIEGLLNKQSQKNGLANGVAGGSDAWKGTKWENDVMIEVDDETRAAAQKEIEEGGYYSVGETAKRLLDFAVSISGGDPSKIEPLKGAVEKGFKNAAAMWGDELPQISQDTYAAVMKGFDEWEAAGDSSAITLLNANE